MHAIGVTESNLVGSAYQSVEYIGSFNLDSNTGVKTPNLGTVKKIDGKPVINVKSDEESVLEKFSNGQLLAKMLCDYNRKQEFTTERLIDEISELNCKGNVRASSTTFLDPRLGIELYRHMGLLLDAEKCNIRHINTADASTERLGDNNEECKWNRKLRTYTCHPHNKENEVNFSGKFTTDDLYGTKIESIEHLRQIPLENLEKYDGLLVMNEVVVDYDQNSILGFIATTDAVVRWKKKHLSLNSIKEDCNTMQLEANKHGLILSNSFLYNPIINKLSCL